LLQTSIGDSTAGIDNQGPSGAQKVYIGALNDAYYTNPTGGSSFLYWCFYHNGNNKLTLGSATFSVNAGTPAKLAPTFAGASATIGNSSDLCSPMSEFLNVSSDRGFVGLTST